MTRTVYTSVITSIQTLGPTFRKLIKVLIPSCWTSIKDQIASAQIPLSHMPHPGSILDDDFTADINNSEEPKILVVSNNSDRQAIYEPTLSLYNSCLVKLIDKKDN